MSSVVISGDTSGTVTLAAPAVAGTSTLTLQAATATSAVNTLGTAVTCAGQTSIDFTGLPSWIKRITVLLRSVSTSGTSLMQIQIGSGSFDTSGYGGAAGGITNGGASGTEAATRTSGIPIMATLAAADLWDAHVTLTNIGSNVWIFGGITTRTSPAPYSGTCGGEKSLSGALDRLRLTTVNGTDTFDTTPSAGTVNILYEG